MSLDVRGIEFSYGRRQVLHDVSVQCARGTVLGLLGPNGCGKSTLLRCICRILRPAAGRVCFDGTDLLALPARDAARTVAYVPQSSRHSFSITVTESVLLGRTPHFGFRPGADDRMHVEEAIAMLDLGDLAERRVDELSGGQAQRVLVARALAQQPAVLLLDEPTSALDLRHQLDTMAIVRQVARDRGVAAVVAIHDLNHAARFCDELAVMADGRIAAHGAAHDVLTPELVQRVYDVGVETTRHRGVVEVRPLPEEYQR